MFQKLLNNRFVTGGQRLSLSKQIRSIRRKQSKLEQETDRQLIGRCRTLQFSVRSGQSLRSALPDAFALVCEVVRRVHGFTPYDVQLMGGISLCKKSIVEMATGEGKTLTVLLPLFLRALEGKGVLLATANDYLAVRDCEFALPVFEKLGMTVAPISEVSEEHERKIAYACDVTYGTAAQFGFDFLRDRAKQRFARRTRSSTPPQTVGRGRLYCVIIDEADSLLIDEAATPLLLSGAAPPVSDEKQDAYYWAAKIAPQLEEGIHYRYKRIDKKSELKAAGRKWVYQQLPESVTSTLSMIDYYDYVERAVNIDRDFLLDRNYIIRDDEVQLVDEGTGRVGKGREWSEGIQQAVQAKEEMPLTFPSGHLAKVTIQSFFLAFEHMSGITGTARQAEGELRENYKLSIREIPTRLPSGRRELTPQAYSSFQPWLESIHAECLTIRQAGRSTLIGARNVAHSEMISQYLTQQGLDNQLLNARLDEVEAEIVGQAGQPGRVTVATNMAGRGTDIKLHPDVKSAGGLHVILAGIHPSKRIDRQLVGRVGRQGDPGSYRKMLCLDDDLLDAAFSTEKANLMRVKMRAAFSPQACLELFDKAQRLIAKRNRTNRKTMFFEDKKNLRYLYQAGLDPLLDIPG